MLDGGACPVGIESAIVDCTRARPVLLRPGQIGRDAIERALGAPLAAADRDSAGAPRAPGTLASHYAPAVPLLLLSAPALTARLQRLDAAGSGEAAARVGVYSRSAVTAPPGSVVQRRMPPDAVAAARELFAVLRALEASGVTAIWVEHPPAGVQWDGVRDRLQRAAA